MGKSNTMLCHSCIPWNAPGTRWKKSATPDNAETPNKPVLNGVAKRCKMKCPKRSVDMACVTAHSVPCY